MYSSGRSITSNTMLSDSKAYDYYNSYGETTFRGYAYIDFKSKETTKNLQVGRLMFRTTKLKENLIKYFNVTLKESFKRKILKKR